MEFKDKIKYVRGLLLLSQQALANELKVSFCTINRLESGKCSPSFITTNKFDAFCEKNSISFEVKCNEKK